MPLDALYCACRIERPTFALTDRRQFLSLSPPGQPHRSTSALCDNSLCICEEHEPTSRVTFGAAMMKSMLCLTTALCAALTPPSRPLAARSLTTSLAAASGPQRQILLVAAGVLAKSGRVLLQQRSDPPQLAGLWEFPGGKVDPGETLEKALARELDEELAISVEETDLEPIAFTCVEIRILRRVRAESSRRPPRHRRDACSMAWRCRTRRTG